MKKLVLILAVVMTAIVTLAAPALRGTFTITQADGTLLTVEQFGDEYHHWTATTDGTLVVPTRQGYMVAQIDDHGQLVPSKVLAHEPAQRGSEERLLVTLQATRRAMFEEQGRAAARRAVHISTTGSYLPHTGTPRVLAVLAAYEDVDFTVNEPVKAFEQYLNGDHQEDLGNKNTLNMSSVRQYFETSSHQKFAPQFDLIGPVTLPQKMEYYGGTSDKGSDDKFSEFCKDVLEQVKDLVPDWTVYDNDKDGVAELVCVIFAGYGQNQGGENNTLWAKASYQNLKVNDQIKIARFNCCSEKFHPDERYQDYINGTGVFIHEFSHCMGLPDLYATTSKAYVNNQGMEAWSIMNYGLYNRNGFAPSLYTAWEQEVMEWTDIEPLTDARQIGQLAPTTEGGKAYKIVNSDNDRDYIIMENVQQRGLNKYLPGHGLLVYHVDYPRTVVNMTDSPNNNPGHPSVAVVPAGGLQISSYLRGSGKTYTTDEWKASMASAVFPGTKEVNELTDEMELPNYCFWESSEKKATGFILTSILESPTKGIDFDFCTPTSTFSLTYLVDGEIYKTYKLRFKDEIIPEEEPTREGYAFSGWNYVPTTMPAHDVTVQGSFTTGVSEVRGQKEDVRGVYYNLQGQRVSRPAKGLFIMGNKKVMVR